jgi:hypothetical protein
MRDASSELANSTIEREIGPGALDIKDKDKDKADSAPD